MIMNSGIKKQKLVKATIHTTTQGAEILSALLPSLGIESLSIEDPSDLDFIIASKDRLAWDFVEGANVLGDGAGVTARSDGDETAVDARSCNNEAVQEVLVSFWLEAAHYPDTEKALQDVRELLLKMKSDEQYGLYGEDADFGRLWMHTETDEDDWIEKYREGFRSFSPCEGIIVAPPWEEERTPEEDRLAENKQHTKVDHWIRIIIDPGMAFGTGSHETTAMCLEKIKELINPGSSVKRGSSVLDVGAGSGILSIAAALLGAGNVCAVEIDEDAASSARANIALNGVDDRIHLIVGDITEPGFLQFGVLSENARFDLIVANLSCALIEKVLPAFTEVLAVDGRIILSGLLDTQEEMALEAVRKADLKTTEICISGEWLALVVSKAGELSTAEVSR